MNIAILSSISSYHHLAQILQKEGSNVFHYGANPKVRKIENYHPVDFDLPISGMVSNEKISSISQKIESNNIDFVIASGIPLCRKQILHDTLKQKNIPYFFANPESTIFEIDKSKTKEMFEYLKLPTPKSKTVDGKFLFENFKSLKRPFVIKLNYVFQFGRQTMIVTDENFENIYLDLFSIYIGRSPNIFNINFDTKITLEEFIKLKKEYSYHLVANKTGWKYLGSARDYKREFDNDVGHNTLGMGAYNTNEIDETVHDYSDKIINFLKINQGINYKGFMFLNIGVDENDNHQILEINTRSGNPEIQVILDSLENNLSNLFYALSTDAPIPEITHNSLKSVTVRLANKFFDWNKPIFFPPNLKTVSNDIIHSLENGIESRMFHSCFTAKSNSLDESSKRIYNYLKDQSMGQFYYRKDIGILK